MAFTVTATSGGGGASSRGMFLVVNVYTGATEAGGSSAHLISATGATPEFSFTPAFSNSLIAFALSGDNPGAASFTAAASNTMYQTGFFSSDDWAWGQGFYSGTVTASSAVTAGGTCTSSDYTTYAAYEIQPSAGSTPALDPSTPALAQSTTTFTATTASFAPPGGAVIAALIVGGSNGASAITMTVTDTSGLGLTWTARASNAGLDQGAFVFTTTLPGGAAPAFPAASVIQPVSVLPGRRGWQGANHSR